MKNRPVVIKTFPLEEIFPLVEKQKAEIEVDGNVYTVYLGRPQQILFLNHRTCVRCGKEGNHYRLMYDKTNPIPCYQYFLNLYSKEGSLMTADHIIPKSLGGPTTLDNLQCMCRKCNNKKGNKLPENLVVKP